MGGKSRKSGGISKALVNRLTKQRKATKNDKGKTGSNKNLSDLVEKD